MSMKAEPFFLQTGQLLERDYYKSFNHKTRHIFFKTYPEFNAYYGGNARDENEFYQLNLAENCHEWVDSRYGGNSIKTK